MLGEVARATELWVVCHGYGQLASHFLERFVGLSNPGRVIVAPEGLSRFYLDPFPHGPKARVGASWMTSEDRDHEIEDHVRYLDQLLATLRPEMPGGHTVVLGFSQGTATVGRWISRGQSNADHVIFWAGSIPRDADLALAQREGRIHQVDLVHGRSDELIPSTYVEREVERLRSTGLEFELREFDGGHTIDNGLLESIAAAGRSGRK
jgi:predicted esterase